LEADVLDLILCKGHLVFLRSHEKWQGDSEEDFLNYGFDRHTNWFAVERQV
jgi:hypothetical protein